MTVRPATYNDFIIFQGATFEELLTFTDSNGVVIDLTGYTARMEIRDSCGTVVIVELTTENGGITIDGANGTVTLSIAAADTALLLAGVYVYDLELITGVIVQRYMQGSIVISCEVTT